MRKIVLLSSSMNDVSIYITGEGVFILRDEAVDQGLRKAKKDEFLMNKFTDDFIKSLVLDRLNQQQRNSGRSDSFRPTGRTRIDPYFSENDSRNYKTDAQMSQLEVLRWLTDIDADEMTTEIDDFLEETDDDIPW